MYEFTDRELRDLIDSLPRVVYARQHPPIRVHLLGVKQWLKTRRLKRYRHWRK